MSRQDGFSLIEMLAALGVLAIAGLALMNALTTTMRAASLTQDRAIASIAADNIMAQLIAEQEINPLTDQSGRYEIAGRQYDWRLAREQTARPSLYSYTLILVDSRTSIEQVQLVSFIRDTQ